MKILILGGTGMVGYNLYKSLKEYNDIFLSVRNNFYGEKNLFSEAQKVIQYDANDAFSLDIHLRNLRPDVIINAIGITKQKTNVDVKNSIYINSLFPHHINKMCQQNRIRLVTLSTDCIFSGKKGSYTESDISDAEDIYGRSKYLGEINSDGSITLRKSTIGLEINNKHGLIEWWLSETGKIKGYKKAIYSGIITSELGNVINLIIHQHPDLNGIWNISSTPISKYDLLSKLALKLDRKDIEMIQDENFVCDRSLDSGPFKALTKYKTPTWDQMLDTLSEEILNNK